MATTSIATLHSEIQHLEQELSRRRRALAILQHGKEISLAGPVARLAVARRGQPVTTTRSALEKLFTTAPSLRLTPKQIRDRLQRSGVLVTPDTVQRQLRRLVRAKVVRAQNGQYRLAPKRPTKPRAAAAKPATASSARAIRPSAPMTTKS